jgi:hypothetical protein
VRDIVYSGKCFQTSSGRYLGKYERTDPYPAPSKQLDLVFEEGRVPYKEDTIGTQLSTVDVKESACESMVEAPPKNNTNYSIYNKGRLGLGGRRRKTRGHKKTRKHKRTRRH